MRRGGESKGVEAINRFVASREEKIWWEDIGEIDSGRYYKKRKATAVGVVGGGAVEATNRIGGTERNNNGSQQGSGRG
jgi:hypothetical protein